MTTENKATQVTENQGNIETPEQELLRLRQENAKLKQDQALDQPTIKWSEKGCISIYGLGRFPVSLYPFFMAKLLRMVPQIEAFVKANQIRFDESVSQHGNARLAKKLVTDTDRDVSDQDVA
jgi:hypothetical protein